MFGKVTCSNKIAESSMDVFSDLKSQIQKGADKIAINLANRTVLRDESKARTAELEAEMAKDVANLSKLENKIKALDELI